MGSSSYITNLDGEVVQHIEYVPFGEVFLEEKNSKWNTPYLFTSKELDRETGLYYFGARYQDPKLGIFLGVDPKAMKYPGISSYAYAVNNPVKYIDPDGKEITFAETVREDGTKLITMTVTGKMINQSGKAYTPQQMKSYAERLSNGIKEAYGICGDKFEVNVVTNITVASMNNPLSATDHAFMLVDDGKIADANNFGGYRPEGVIGHAAFGELGVYMLASLVDNKPATEGYRAGTGKTQLGQPTLEETGAHELGHTGTLRHTATPRNLMNAYVGEDSGGKVTQQQIIQMQESYDKGELNKGRQCYD